MAHSEGSFQRWQTITITQLGYATNLLLAFSAASLGFVLSLFKDQQFTSDVWRQRFLLSAIVASLVSTALGLWCVVNRLRDFRKTATIARDRAKWERQRLPVRRIDSSLRSRRVEVKKLGRNTWRILCWQITAFLLEMVFIAAAYISAYGPRLF